MIIDFHTHIFPDKIAAGVIDKLQKKSRSKPYTDATAGGLLQSMQDAGIDTFIEVGPGHTLTGLVKRTLEGVDAVCVEIPEAAEEARALVAGKGLI